MSRAPVSVVVVASGTAEVFRDCLGSLRAGCVQHDEVVCVVPAARPDLAAVVEAERWLTVVQDATGRAADVWGAGVDATTHPVVVLLDGDVLVAEGWLEPVVAAFADAGVVAAGPRVDRCRGPQEAHLPPHALRGGDAFQEFARQWREQRRGQRSTVEELGAVCVAVRREALAAAGGPDAELPAAQLAGLGRVEVVHESLVAHLRTPRCTVHGLTARHGPFLSAVVLTRDDEGTIEDCLRSVQPFADELLVYDLGSADGTRKRAAELGATVVGGRFDGDYGAARSRALAAATGEWVLSVDPDETVAGDPKAVRGKLLFAGADVVLVPVHGGPAALRLFKRRRVRFAGRRHETPVDRVSGEPVTAAHTLELLELTPRDGAPAGNLRTVRRPAAELASRLDRAQTAITAGDYDDAAELCRDVIDGCPGGEVYESALKTLMNALIPIGRLAEANEALEELRARSANPSGPLEWQARIRFAEGGYQEAVDSVRRLPERPAPYGPPAASRDQLAEIEIKSLFQLGHRREAAARLRECLRAGLLPLSLAETAEALEAVGAGLAEAVELLPAERRHLLYQLVRVAPADLGDQVLEALWALPGEAAAVLDAVAHLGWMLSLHRAHAWSVRLRDHGLARHCALLRVAGHPGRSSRDRALAAAVVMERFGADEAMPLLSEALGELPGEDEQSFLDELRLVAPGVATLITPVKA